MYGGKENDLAEFTIGPMTSESIGASDRLNSRLSRALVSQAIKVAFWSIPYH